MLFTEPSSSLLTFNSKHNSNSNNKMDVPGEFDVICGRGKICSQHPGNRRLSQIVKQHIDQYSQATSKLEKSLVVSDIVNMVKQKGTFVKQVSSGGRYFYNVSERMTREKVGQMLRDALHTQYKSSNQAKRKRRFAEMNDLNSQVNQFLRNNKAISSVMSQLAMSSTSLLLSNQNDADGSSNVSMMQGYSDRHMGGLFDEANVQILAELKRCQVTFDDFSDDDQSDAAASGYCVPSSSEVSCLVDEVCV